MLNEELTVNAGLLCGQLLLPFTICLAMVDATADAAEDMLSKYLFMNEYLMNEAVSTGFFARSTRFFIMKH